MRQSEACAPATDRAGRHVEGLRHLDLGDPVGIRSCPAATRIAHIESVSADRGSVRGLQTGSIRAVVGPERRRFACGIPKRTERSARTERTERTMRTRGSTSGAQQRRGLLTFPGQSGPQSKVFLAKFRIEFDACCGNCAGRRRSRIQKRGQSSRVCRPHRSSEPLRAATQTGLGPISPPSRDWP